MTIKIAKARSFDRGAPRLMIPGAIGASPGKPIFMQIPCLGERPIHFTYEGFPKGLTGSGEGFLKGSVTAEGSYPVKIIAENSQGKAEKQVEIRIKPGGVCQTPLMGWTSWNAFKSKVTQEDIERQAQALVASGLSSFGYQYVNLDSTWQGEYGGPHDAVMSNEKFPDMKKMCDYIHSLGLKCGIYSTPMEKAWGAPAGHENDRIYPGCTRGERDNRYRTAYPVGLEHYEKNNVAQWCDWGFDYLKYDWGHICDTDNAELMRQALEESPRDFSYCITVGAVLSSVDYWSKHCQSWRFNPDSWERWDTLKQICFTPDDWAQYCQPGHFFDLDMLESGVLCKNHAGDPVYGRCVLTENEQLVGYTMRALFPSPIQLSCDLTKLNEFEINMFCNEEVIEVNQDILCSGAICVDEKKSFGRDYQLVKHTRVYERELSDGTLCIGFFNIGETEEQLAYQLNQPVDARDLWAKEDLGTFEKEISFLLEPHSVRLLKIKNK